MRVRTGPRLGWAGQGEWVREGGLASRVVEVGDLGSSGLVAVGLGRLASNRWRGRSKQAKDETRG